MTHRFAKSRRSEIIEQCTLLPGFELHHTTHQMTPHDHCKSHDHHMTITWPSHDHHMTIMYSLVPSISHLCFLIAYSTCTVIKKLECAYCKQTSHDRHMTHCKSHDHHMTHCKSHDHHMTITWHMQVTRLSHDHHIPLHTTEPQQRWGEPGCLFSRDHDIISIRTKPERWCFACFNQLYIQRLVCTIVAFTS